jgi:hypothetical protein
LLDPVGGFIGKQLERLLNPAGEASFALLFWRLMLPGTHSFFYFLLPSITSR